MTWIVTIKPLPRVGPTAFVFPDEDAAYAFQDRLTSIWPTAESVAEKAGDPEAALTALRLA